MFARFQTLSLRQKTVSSLSVISALLLLLSAFLWWHTLSLNPRRVFWGALEQSLSTRSITMQSMQEASGTKNEQSLQLDFGPEAAAHSFTTLTRGSAVVKTENLSTLKADYTRYVSVKNNGKDNAKAKKVIGVWANTTDVQRSRSTAMPPIFGQVLLSRAVPVGNLPPEQRRSLLEIMRADNVYSTSYDKVKKQRKNGRLQYVYDVKLQPILYIRLMKNYAKMMGLKDLEQVDPNSYSGVPAITIQFTVDARSRQLAGVNYGQERREVYGGYGLPVATSAPAHPISAGELQKRMAALR